MIHGLYHELQTAKVSLAGKRDFLASGEGSPRLRHDATRDRDELLVLIPKLEEAISEDEAMVSRLQGVINQAATSKFKSRHRSLVLTGLEDVQSRLLRELGGNPESIKTA